MKDYFISDFTNSRFQSAFKTYFKELGINVKDWDGLFKEMNEDEGNLAYVRMTEEAETVVGFIQFKKEILKNWFFEEELGFIREFWIAEEHRKKSHGSELLEMAEQYFMEQNVHKTILTTDTAEKFYLSKGYRKDPAYQAKNKDDVYVKNLV